MITRKDVADRAKVSISVVTRVMNRSGYVSQLKQEAVLKAAKELGYHPSPVARSLKSGRTRQILFFRGGLSGLYYQELYQGIIDYAQQFGYVVFSSRTLPVEQMGNMMMDGIILPVEVCYQKEYRQLANQFKLPVVILSYGEKLPDKVYRVDVDTGKGMEEILGLLWSKGHRKIAYAGYNIEDPRGANFLAFMQKSIKKRLDDYVLLPPDQTILREHNAFYRIGAECADLFVQRQLDASAVACFNDDVAIGFCHRITRLGLRVPEDVSVTGFDNTIIGEYLRPALTSFSLNTYEHGGEAAHMMIDLLEGKKSPRKRSLETRLIERESIAPIGGRRR
ncbi:DNA-binding transcriptional regulator CytR [Spirochaetia bacterium]|nr:DNA-binding transcriptional regulator CytR [Spirochaetia bacterium]